MAADNAEHEAIQPYHPGATPIRVVAPAAEAPAELHIARERLTTFFGAEVCEPRPRPVFAVVFALVGLAGIVLGAVNASATLLCGLGIGPMLLALVLWLVRPPALRMRISEAGLAFEPSHYFLPYERIYHVFAPRREQMARFAIHLLGEGGYITLARNIAADCEELYQFLRTQPLGKQTLPAEVDPAFYPFLRQQLALHGSEQITVYQTRQWHERQIIRSGWRSRGPLRGALALFCGGLFWFIAAFALPTPTAMTLLAPAITAFVLSLVFVAGGLSESSRSKVARKLRNSMLFVSPTGLALVQGDLKGELRWSEIRKVTRRSGASFTLSSADVAPGVVITVQGATILIADVYQWPPEHIEALIRGYAGL